MNSNPRKMPKLMVHRTLQRVAKNKRALDLGTLMLQANKEIVKKEGVMMMMMVMMMVAMMMTRPIIMIRRNLLVLTG